MDKVIPYIKDENGDLIPVAVMYDADGNEIVNFYAKKSEIENIEQIANEAKTSAEDAASAAQTAQESAESASEKATLAASDAEEAAKIAQELDGKIDEASEAADKAQEIADSKLDKDTADTLYDEYGAASSLQSGITGGTIVAATASATAGKLTIKLDDAEEATYPTTTFNGSNATADVAGYVASLGYATETYADAAEKAANIYTDGKLEGYATVASLSDYSTKAETVTAVAVDGADISVTTNGVTVTTAVNNVKNAESAKQLSTGRTMQTDLSSTSEATFDGTADVTLGVTGTLPVGNGGTGATSLDNVTVGNATTARKLGSSTIGSATKPIYLSSGTATDCSDMADTLTDASVSIGDTGATLTFSRLDGEAATATIPLAGDTAGLMSKEDKANLDKLMLINSLNPVLDENSWSDISKASLAGVAADIWNIGDTKQIHLEGTMGTITLDQDVLVYIIGFDHNSALEGKNTIHFGTFKDPDAGTDLCLIDGNYNSNSSDGTHYFSINHWGSSSSPYNTNYGGWAACDMRYDILGSTDNAPSPYGETKTTDATGKDPSSACATNPLDGTLLSCFPLDLREVMRPMTKHTDNVGNSSTAYEAVTATQDYLPLLAHLEILSSSSYPNSNEATFQERYEYYANGNSAVKYRHTATGSTAYWWDRSPYCSNAWSFCIIYTSGGGGTNTTRGSYGVAPAFCV